MLKFKHSNSIKLEIQWTYQTCNEFGFYQTSDKKEKLFGDRFPLDFFIKQCTDFYGRDFDGNYLTNSISKTNKYYGALRPKTTNVLYVHGSIDPWHALGIVESSDPRVPAIYIEGKDKDERRSRRSAQKCLGQADRAYNIHT